MKLVKHTEYDGLVERVDFPNKGSVLVKDTESGESATVLVKGGIPGQTVRILVSKVRHGQAEGRIIEVLQRAGNEYPIGDEKECRHCQDCGGCAYQSLPYKEQIQIKEQQMKRLFAPYFALQKEKCGIGEEVFGGVTESPVSKAYRNKMEFSFGDEYKDGPLSLGMHKKGSFYDILFVPMCQIVDEDYRKILSLVLSFCKEKGMHFYHKLRHEGYLRHLLVRKAVRTGEIMVAIVTSTQENREDELMELSARIAELPLEGKLTGVLHTKNDSLADVVQSDETRVLYGQDYFYEEILGLRFKITEFSFFQTNSLGAEVLYNTAREFIGDISMPGGKKPVIYDLYSGTGTIAQMMAPVASKVIGVEIVEEAVEAAKENAALNGLHNCEFIAGDVLKVLDDINEKPDFIILDPPRDGIHPKALPKIIGYGVDRLVYISCKPTSLARDLEVFLEAGYVVKKMQCVDMFPGTVHVETCVLLSRGTYRQPDARVKIDVELEDYYAIKDSKKE